MENLQALYDHFIKTKPSAGKIRAATTLMIRICKALDMDAPEEVTHEIYVEIPQAIDEYYGAQSSKALQDKSMLAEVIGRFGPRQNWENVIDKLLEDEDQNLRLFTLQSLSYYGREKPESVLSYVERYMQSNDLEMKNGAAKLLYDLLKSKQADKILPKIKSWSKTENADFLLNLRESLEKSYPPELNQEFLNWLPEADTYYE